MSDAKRVLIVDDDDIIREAAEMILARKGLEVATAKDLDEAREALAKHEPFQLILLDVSLKKTGDGIDFLIELRKELKLTCPVLIITGAFDLERIRLATENVISGFLIKPFTAGFLEDKVFEAIGKSFDLRKQA